MTYLYYSRTRLVILFTLFLWSLIIFFPGTYTVDSWWYFREVTGIYNDWHGPMVPFTWKVLYIITGQYYSIYVAIMALYWLFIYRLVGISSGRLTFLVGILMAVYFLFIPQYVMKDTMLALAWVWACICMVQRADDLKVKAVWKIGVFLLIVYGIFVKANVIIAALPILYIFVEKYLFKNRSVKRIIAVVLAICILITAGYYLFTYQVLKAQRTYPQHKLMLLDIAGISKETGRNQFPECITSFQGFDYDRIMREYNPASIDPLYWPPDGSVIFPQGSAEQNECVKEKWLSLIKKYPVAYLSNRAKGFLYYLRIKQRFSPADYWNIGTWSEPNPELKLESKDTEITRVARYIFKYPENTPFFSPWFWTVLNILLTFVFFRKHRKTGFYRYKVLSFFQLSGVIFILSNFPVYQHDRDFRYNYWNVFLFIVGVVYILADVTKKKDATIP